MAWDGKTILITGGTGTFGKAFVRQTLRDHDPEKLIVFSRDEWKQKQLREELDEDGTSLRFFIGNVRDRDRVERALDGVDVVVHAAALKQVPTAEYNPFEAVKTNVLGAQNVIDAALSRDVEKVVALSTDKAANPINLYGATKLCSDKLFIAGNSYSGNNHPTSFSVVRYGNVIGSRGSVVPRFLDERKNGVLPITDMRMTRFWITPDRAVRFVAEAVERMVGGEIFVPKIPSMRIRDLARALAPDAELKEVGIRPGEKLHEVIIPRNEARYAVEFGDHFVITPSIRWWNHDEPFPAESGERVPDGFEYSSDSNDDWLTVEELRSLLRDHTGLDAASLHG